MGVRDGLSLQAEARDIGAEAQDSEAHVNGSLGPVLRPDPS
jgi:hypothetical protein